MQDIDVEYLMQDHGYDLTLTRAGSGGTYDPATGTITGAGTPISETVRGVFIEYEDQRINNTTILAGDRKLLLQARGIPVIPQIGDKVGDMRIVGPVRTIRSGQTTIAYTAQTRA